MSAGPRYSKLAMHFSHALDCAYATPAQTAERLLPVSIGSTGCRSIASSRALAEGVPLHPPYSRSGRTVGQVNIAHLSSSAIP